MATRAIIAEPAAVRIMTAVAVYALVPDLGRITWPGVASRTDQPFVLAGQGKFGLAIMIEPPHFPVGRVVTILALGWLAQRSLVGLVLVAGRAGQPFGRKALVRMTGHAGQGHMFAQQRELGQIMVEPDPFFPAFSIVASPAICAEPPGMRIFLGVAGAALAGKLHFQRRLGVTSFTLGGRVFSGQGKLCHRVVVERDLLPVSLIVALGAILAIAALVGIVSRMAGKTGVWRLGDLWWLLVTSLALGRAVRAFQRKLGRVMVEAGLLPVAGIVATAAIGPVRSLVAVILRMAGKAGPGWVLVGISGPVTPGAGRGGMPTNQRKTCCRMVERRGPPRCGAVARSAIGAAASLVSIILGVAADASCRKILPTLSGMAAHAGLLGMGSGQRKSGRSMVEPLDLFPGSGVMATLACAPKLAFVWIERAMAAGTIARPTAIVVTPMAAAAFRPFVRTGQGEVGVGVIEAGLVEDDQRVAAPLVITVTRFAGPIAGGRELAMEFGACPDIRGNPAMTGQAAAVLRLFPERRMARIALRLKLGMSAGQRSGRDKTLHDSLGHGGRGQTQAKQPE